MFDIDDGWMWYWNCFGFEVVVCVFDCLLPSVVMMVLYFDDLYCVWVVVFDWLWFMLFECRLFARALANGD